MARTLCILAACNADFYRDHPIRLHPFGGDAWGTPTEGGAIGAFVIFVMALYKGMRWSQLKDALMETAKTNGDDFHHHLVCVDLRSLPGVCPSAASFF